MSCHPGGDWHSGWGGNVYIYIKNICELDHFCLCVCNFLKLCLASKIGVRKDRPAQILEGWEYRWLRYFEIFFPFPAVGVLKSSDAEEAITSSIQPLLKQSQPAHPISPMYKFQIWLKAFPGFDQIPLFGTGFLWSAILVFESIQRPGILFNTRRPLQLEYPIVTISSLQCDAWKDVCVCVLFLFFFSSVSLEVATTIFQKWCFLLEDDKLTHSYNR